MSNRLLGILIILGFIAFGYFYYKYEYLPLIEKEKSNKQEINLKQEKKIGLKKIENINLEKSSLEKIEEIKEKQKNYRSFEIDNKKIFFRENERKLDLFYLEKYIGDFEKVDKSKIFLEKIYSGDNDLFIKLDEKKYIYNSSIGKINSFTLNISINYIKKYENNYLIKTEKGTFIYDFFKNELNYFSLLNDFIFYEDNLIGLINSEENMIKNNLGLSEYRDNLIISFNQNTKEKKVILETDKNLNKIYMKETKIYFEDIENNIFELENY